MVTKQEIMRLARLHNLTANTIEKDYILSWILFGINNSNELKNKWIFKGGTCLKKCFFENYRFSEDLDFTITDANHINKEFLLTTFEKIADWIYEQSGIEIPIESLDFEEYKNPRGELSIQGTVPYKGPMRRSGNTPTIKLDLTNDEVIVNPPEIRSIHHPYSDTESMSIQAYCIEEILAEKLRALVERLRPRDLYDIIHIHYDNRWNPNQKLVKNALAIKCDFKGVPIPTMVILESSGKKQDLLNDWNDMLAHQIANLESHNFYWSKLPQVFEWLNG